MAAKGEASIGEDPERGGLLDLEPSFMAVFGLVGNSSLPQVLQSIPYFDRYSLGIPTTDEG